MGSNKQRVEWHDIEKLTLLSEDVLLQLEFYAWQYDKVGQRQAGKIKIKEEDTLVLQMETEEFDLNKAKTDTVEMIKERLMPVKKKILGIYRNGTIQDGLTNETNYYADENIPDEYLLELFAMTVRNKRILLAAQRLPKTYFLLMFGYSSCHDGDEFLGIYTNVKKLRAAYEKALKKKKEDEAYKDDKGLEVMIYEFDESNSSEGFLKAVLVTIEELWG